jgi:hypothetical protein
MAIKTAVSYPRFASRPVDCSASRSRVPTAVGTGSRAGSVSRAAAIAVACLIEAILILGVALAATGVVSEGRMPADPDRQSPVETLAPEPSPRAGF